MKTPTLVLFISIIIVCFNLSMKPIEEEIIKKTPPEKKIDVAAYFWPSCQNEARSKDKLWGEGIGEWEVIKKGKPRFEGHYQPRQPLWGYLMDDDPKAMEKQIDAATDHGVNVFIFDWYWYDGQPFLEEALNKGFLKARNKDKMKFYLMWANHDVPGSMWNPYRYKTDEILFEGNVSPSDYKTLVNRIINKYFKEPNYYKIGNKPVFSIYSLEELVQSFDGLEGTRKALEYLRSETLKAGFDGLHIQLVGNYGPNNSPSLGEDYLNVEEISKLLGASSVTMYNMAGNDYRRGDYLPYLEKASEVQDKWDKELTVPFVPVVSVGWDNTPRYLNMGKDSIIYFNNTPASFGAGLLKAKKFVQERPEQPQLMIINAWNEWVEGSYLQPDMLNGFGYLEAVKKVMQGSENDN